MSTHVYESSIAWSGSTGAGYAAYSRDHRVAFGGATIPASADRAFLGSAEHPNPEQLFLAAASSCQLLSFLAVAARAGVDVLDYQDDATAIMPSDARPVRITQIVLSPTVRVRAGDAATVCRLMHEAHEGCFIANTLNASVEMDITVEVAA
jgi:organic hydroperoxide reductase OsmC/OhrA